MNDSTQPAADLQPPVYLADYSKQDAKWDAKRSQTQDIENIYHLAQKYERLAERMHDCSGRLTFGRVTNRDTGEIRLKLIGAKFCKVRNCPTCQWRRSVKNLSRFNAKLPEIQKLYPKHRWLFLTLTVPNCRYEDLRETVKAMNKGWARLIERKDWPATGWIRATEVTNEAGAEKGRKRAGYAHPHFHIMVMVPPSFFTHGYIKQSRWLELWQESMRNPEISQVNIKAIKPGADLRDAIQETLKYSLKVEDALTDPEFLYCLTSQLHKMRFLATGGVLKNLLKEQMTDKEMVEGDQQDGEEIEGQLSFDYSRKSRKYQLKTVQN